MERATQAWAETSIGGVVLSRTGISRMISALQCKYSTRKPNVTNYITLACEQSHLLGVSGE